MAKKSRYPHIDAMTSSQLDAFVMSDNIAPDEYAYAMRRLKRLSKE